MVEAVFQISNVSRVKNPRKLAPWPDTLSCWARKLGKIRVFWPPKNLLWPRDSKGWLELCRRGKRYLLHPFSSVPSLQSFSPSQTQLLWTHWNVSLHWNSELLHFGLLVGQPISSELSPQSLSPSHFHELFMHRPLFLHMNSVALQVLFAVKRRKTMRENPISWVVEWSLKRDSSQSFPFQMKLQST